MRWKVAQKRESHLDRVREIQGIALDMAYVAWIMPELDPRFGYEGDIRS